MGSAAARSDASISLLMEKNPEPDKSCKFNLRVKIVPLTQRKLCFTEKRGRSMSFNFSRTLKLIGRTRISVGRVLFHCSSRITELNANKAKNAYKKHFSVNLV